ncbi:hypothetical protein INR49_010882 [Caranx melampygus]|nr:hypothetical protein INR49_010882 [Caranx melampygus]
MENRRVQLKGASTHSLTWHVPAPHPASISLNRVSCRRTSGVAGLGLHSPTSNTIQLCLHQGIYMTLRHSLAAVSRRDNWSLCGNNY